MIPGHDEAVNSALVAIAEAYQTGKPGYPEWPAEPVEARARHILQELRNERTRAGHVEMLEDRVDTVALPVGALVRLLLDAMDLPEMAMQNEIHKREADERFSQRTKMLEMVRHGFGAANQRYAAALRVDGLLAGEHGEGRTGRNWQAIADRYFGLRTGCHRHDADGVLRKIEPHSHADAVELIEDEQGISWESIERQWRRHAIAVSYSAEVFPKE